MPELKLKLTAGTNAGLVRNNNEDNSIVCPALIANDWTIPQADEVIGLGPYGALLVVADGMGGANAGEVASGIAIDIVQQCFSHQQLSNVIKNDVDILRFLHDVTLEADKAIIKHGKKHKEARGMGTTLVMAWLLHDKAYICWCGDSRCYVYNQKIGLTRLSKDHSLVQQLVDSGELLPENAHDHPMSNVITQCLGNASKDISPGTRIYQLSDGDVLLLCSDGLCGLCTDDEIVQVITSCDDVIAMKSRLIDEALRAGGYDNVTVALCGIDAPSLAPKASLSAELKSTLRSFPDDVNENEGEDENENVDENEAGVEQPEELIKESDDITAAEAAPQQEEADTPPAAEPEAEAAKEEEEEEKAEQADTASEQPDIDLQKYTPRVILIIALSLFAAAVIISVLAPDAVRQFFVWLSNLLYELLSPIINLTK